MSRTDTDISSDLVHPCEPGGVEVIDPRDVPLGGLRSMSVRRTLPNRQRSTISAWCFIDHYGPDDTRETGGMVVPPHPHTGLQTVSWLFAGDIEHRDSTGVRAKVEPGTLNLMTAGSGVQHSEVSDPLTTTLHGVQLWVVLPEHARHQSPHFEAAAAVPGRLGDAEVKLFLGELEGVGQVDAPTYWPIWGAEFSLPPGARASLPIVEGYETGVLLDQGGLLVNGEGVSAHQLAYIAPGSRVVELRATGEQPARFLALGGKPFDEEIVMWWNFIGRTHEEIVAFREEWQSGLGGGSERFGHLDHLPALPAPEMPSVRLKTRRPGSR